MLRNEIDHITLHLLAMQMLSILAIPKESELTTETLETFYALKTQHNEQGMDPYSPDAVLHT